ncbi:hypothetical protein BDZ97DRAFT_1796052 [Flammula alnicola]|nr:hypothetical protein BDZ97DRAFT_1796052 [Flammula alnicola]
MPGSYYKFAKNPFGYNASERPEPQLQNLLGLNERPNHFKRIEEILKKAGEKHLDISLRPTEQKRSLALIEEQLKRRYPEVYDGEETEKRLYFAIRVIMYHHYKLRAQRKQGRKHIVNIPEEIQPEVLDLTMEDSDSETGYGNQNYEGHFPSTANEPLYDNFEMQQGLEQSSSNSVSSYRAISKKQTLATPSARQALPTIVASSSQVFVENSTGSTHFRATSRSTPKTSQTSGLSSTTLVGNQKEMLNAVDDTGDDTSSHQGSQIPHIHKFLSTCMPPMDALLYLFVDFGCSRDIYLRSMSKWSPEQRYDLLKKILRPGLGDLLFARLNLRVFSPLEHRDF